jgi:cytochrome c
MIRTLVKRCDCPSSILIIATAIGAILSSCNERHPQPTPVNTDSLSRENDYIKPIAGKNDSLLPADVQRGKVLVAYSDCHTCHHEDHRSKGPAFKDIAKRYPIQPGYIELLSQKIIVGSKGAWGNPEMSPHPDIKPEEAKLMAKYILSLKAE